MTTATVENLFTSLPALRAEHRELQREYRAQGNTPAIFARIEEFILRGRNTGAILDDEDDQAAVQALLDLWGAALYRAGRPVPETNLLPFDKEKAPTLDDHLVPYVGPDAFEESKQHIFFGREDMIASLIERIGKKNLLAVSGPSGSGKSSLVLAGIIPALKKGALLGSTGWRYLGRMVPGSSPFENLSRLLLCGHGNSSGSVQALADRLKKKPESLHETIVAGDERTAVLVIDQFEELSTLCEDSSVREAFEKAMVNFVGQGQIRNILILTMRSDFIGAVVRLPEFQKLLETALVPITPLSASELREAITRPAEGIGLKFEPGIVDSLVHDTLGEPAALPLLQFTLLKLWERRGHNRITLEAYRALGGGRLALTRSADEFIDSLIPQERIMAERILLRLVRPGIGQDNVANRIRKVSLYTIGPRENVDRVLNKLVAQHFVRLTAGDTEEDTEVEIAHEALIRNWQHLVSLLETERQHMTTLRRLEIKAAEWVRLGRGTSVVLRDAALAEAEQWLANPDFAALGASNDLRQLVKLSRDEANSARRRDAVVRLGRIVLLVVAAFAIASSIFAVKLNDKRAQAEAQQQIATYNWNEANKQREKAEDLNTQLHTANRELIKALTAAKTAEARSAAEERLYDTDLMGDDANNAIAQDPERASLLALDAVLTLVIHHQPVRKDLMSTLDIVTKANRVRVVLPLSSEVNSLAFSPDGLRLATAATNEPVRIWDAITGQQLAELPGTKNAAALAFSYSGRQIAVALDNRIQILDALSADATAQPHTTGGAVRRLGFSPNDNYVAALTSTGAVELWSPVSQSARTLSPDDTTITAFAFNPTGEVIVTGSGHGLVRTWDTASGSLMQTVAKFEQQEGGVTPLAPINDLAFSPDGLNLQISRSSGQQHLFFTAAEPVITRSKDVFGRISFAADRSLLALEANGGNLFKSGVGLPVTVPVNVSSSVVAFSLDGNRFAAVAHGTTVKIWDAGYLPPVSSNKQPDAGNNQSDKNTPDAIGQAIASLTEGLRSPGDCKDEICAELRAAVPDMVEGNRLARLGYTNRALAKFASVETKARFLQGSGNGKDWARKEVQFIQDQAKLERALQQQRGQVAQAQFMLRSGSSLDSVPEAVRSTVASSAVTLKKLSASAAETLFRSAAYFAAKQEDEQSAAAWLTRAREIAPSKSGTKDSPEAEASQLIVGILVGEAGRALSVKNIVLTLDYIARARKYQQQIPVDTDAVFNNELCWDATISEGNFFNHPEVIASCNRAAVLSKGNPAVLDSLAVNLARNGNYADAIKNFLPYVSDPKSPQDRKSVRERWIADLQKGQDPFTPEVLKQMQRGW